MPNPARRAREAANHSGVMVALYPPPDVAQALALDGGEPVEDLHVTLAYLGDAADLTDDQVAELPELVAAFAGEHPPLEGIVAGLGRFTPDGDDAEDPFYASVDVPGLEEWRSALVAHLEAAGLPVARSHGFTPHLTLAYLAPDAPAPLERIDPLPLTFDSVALAVAGERTTYPLGGPPMAPRREAMPRTHGDTRDLVDDAIRSSITLAPDVWLYVCDLSDAWAVYEIEGGPESGLYRVGYSIDDAGVVTLGTAEPVQRVTTYEAREQTERVAGRVLEARGNAPDGGRIYGVRIIAFGESRNGRIYPASVLTRAAEMYEGAKAFDHHRTLEELQTGTVRGLVGYYRNVEATAHGIEANLHLLPSATHIAEALDASLLATKDGLEPLVGLSHDVTMQTRPVTLGGRRLEEATEITSVLSADVVAEPAAGGLATRAVAGGIGDTTTPEGGHTMDLKQLLAELRGADAARRAELLQEHSALLVDAGLTADDVTKLVTEPAPDPAATDTNPPDDAGDPVLVGVGAGAEISRESIIGRRIIRDAVESSVQDPATANRLVETVTRHLPERFTEDGLRSTLGIASSILTGAERSGLTPGVPHVEVTKESREKAVDRLERTLENKPGGFPTIKRAYAEIAGVQGVDLLDGELPFRIMRETFASAPAEGARRSESVDSTTWGEIFADALHKRMVAEYAAANLQAWQELVAFGSFPDFRDAKLVRMGGYGTLPTVGEGGPYQPLTSPADENVTYAPEKRGGTEDLTLEAIANDDLRAVQRIPRKLGRAAAQTLYRAVFDLFATNPAIYDTVDLFATGHANTDTASALAHSTMAVGRRKMREQAAYGDSSDVLGLVPRFLLVPPELEDLAFQLCTGARAVPATTPGATDVPNLHQGTKPIVVDYWTDANDWFLLADPMDVPTIEVGFYQGKRDPELFVQDDPRVGSVFTADKITWKIRHIWGVTIVDYRGAYRGQG